jgi:hypothetical protein
MDHYPPYIPGTILVAFRKNGVLWVEGVLGSKEGKNSPNLAVPTHAPNPKVKSLL